MVESMNPVVSVCIPVYGVSKYIEKCAISLFEQSIADKAEFVFVNDCTKDDSFEKLKQVMLRYPQLKERIILVEHARNMGLAAARNTAFLQAQGEYIICVDSDDWVEPDYLEKLYTKAKADCADIVGCNLYKEFSHKTLRVKNQLNKNPEECLKSLLDGNTAGWLHEKLIKRSLIVENNIRWIDGLDLWEDVLFSVKIFSYAKTISQVDKHLYHYRYNFASLVNTFSERSIFNLLSVIDEIKIFLVQRNLYERFSEHFFKMKMRVKISIICESNNNLRRKYLSIYPEVDQYIWGEKNISLIKRLAVCMYLSNHRILGSFIIKFIRFIRCMWYK